MGKITDKLKEMGYELHKGHDLCGTISTYGNDDINSINYGSAYIVLPNGERKNITGKLEQPICIGKERFQTCRRDIIIELYNPSEEELFILDNGYSMRTKKVLKKAYESIDLIGIKVFEMGGGDSNVVENETTKPFETNFLNGTADITELDGKFIVQVYHQADIDVFECYQYIFSGMPDKKAVFIAYDLWSLESGLWHGLRIKEYEDGIFWTQRKDVVQYLDFDISGRDEA